MNLFPSSRPNPRISRREGSSPSVRSGRLRPGRWRDPRLAGGAVLLGASVALGSLAVDSATRTEQIYVLAVDVAPGTDLSAEGVLTAVSSHPGTGAYVVVGDLPAGAVSTRSLKAGELLPAAAVSTAQSQDLRALVLNASTGLPAGTTAGDVVDLWSLPDTAAGDQEPAQAQLVAEGLLVSAIGHTEPGLMGTATTSVEVLVDADQVAAVLTAIAQPGGLVLVPTGEAR